MKAEVSANDEASSICGAVTKMVKNVPSTITTTYYNPHLTASQILKDAVRRDENHDKRCTRLR